MRGVTRDPHRCFTDDGDYQVHVVGPFRPADLLGVLHGGQHLREYSSPGVRQFQRLGILCQAEEFLTPGPAPIFGGVETRSKSGRARLLDAPDRQVVEILSRSDCRLSSMSMDRCFFAISASIALLVCMFVSLRLLLEDHAHIMQARNEAARYTFLELLLPWLKRMMSVQCCRKPASHGKQLRVEHQRNVPGLAVAGSRP